METFITLIRGINVGGHHKLPMKELRDLLEESGLKNVRTYIQTGNVVFQREDSEPGQLAETIQTSIEGKFGFEPRVLVLKLEEMERAIADNPFPEAEDAPGKLHLFFFESTPDKPDFSKIESVKKESEQFDIRGRVFYLNAPEGIGRSKLAANIEKYIGKPATARNWRSVQKIMKLAQTISQS